MTNEELLKRIDHLINMGRNALSHTIYDNFSRSVPHDLYAGFKSASLSIIGRMFDESHSYYKQFNAHVHNSYVTNIESGIAILESIKHEIAAGWLTSIKTLVTAEVFSDFLDMGEYLLKESYKDAAAVIIGSVLEDSLRKLADANGIDVVNDRGKLLTIEPLNIEIAKKDVYNLLVKKQVSSWADLRNNAAHGHYDKYSLSQVRDMLSFVTNFTATYLI